MRTIVATSAANSAGAKTAFAVPEAGYGRKGVILKNCDGKLTGTAQLQGSEDGGTTWVNVGVVSTPTAGTAEEVDLYPLMRINITAYTSGSFTSLLFV